jgi:hypothetical protein
MAPMPVAREKLDALGIDELCAQILAPKTLTAIAKEAGVSLDRLIHWVEADPERSARVRSARISSAILWEEQAEHRLDDAADQFGLAKAKELAHHYRWRAAKIAPADYGDRTQHEHSGTVTLEALVGGSFKQIEPPAPGPPTIEHEPEE